MSQQNADSVPDPTVYPRCKGCGNLTMMPDGLCFRCRCSTEQNDGSSP